MELQRADDQATLRTLQRIEGHTQQAGRWLRIVGVLLVVNAAAILILAAVAASG